MSTTYAILLSAEFWNDFWPSFVSTVVGLFIGLPFALWTNRLIANVQDRRRLQEEGQRLKNALKIIRQTLSENHARLKYTIETINGGKVQFDIQLDISAWDAVFDDINYHLHNPDLKKRIAYHFSRLNTMAKLNTMYLDLIGGIGAAIGGEGIEKTRNVLKGHLLISALLLSTDIDEILPLVDRELDPQ